MKLINVDAACDLWKKSMHSRDRVFTQPSWFIRIRVWAAGSTWLTTNTVYSYKILIAGLADMVVYDDLLLPGEHVLPRPVQGGHPVAPQRPANRR